MWATQTAHQDVMMELSEGESRYGLGGYYVAWKQLASRSNPCTKRPAPHARTWRAGRGTASQALRTGKSFPAWRKSGVVGGNAAETFLLHDTVPPMDAYQVRYLVSDAHLVIAAVEKASCIRRRCSVQTVSIGSTSRRSSIYLTGELRRASRVLEAC